MCSEATLGRVSVQTCCFVKGEVGQEQSGKRNCKNVSDQNKKKQIDADLGCVQEQNWYEPVIQAALLDEFILHLKNQKVQLDYLEEVIFTGNMLFKQTHSHNGVNISSV